MREAEKLAQSGSRRVELEKRVPAVTLGEARPRIGRREGRTSDSIGSRGIRWLSSELERKTDLASPGVAVCAVD
eukprot:scaffold149_cov315-Pinguiococcus_pyrenoidosus.AAC.160